MLVGSCIQSTRGCDPEQSIEQVKEALKKGKQFKLISTNNFPDDWMVVAVQGLGGSGVDGYPLDVEVVMVGVPAPEQW